MLNRLARCRVKNFFHAPRAAEPMAGYPGEQLGYFNAATVSVLGSRVVEADGGMKFQQCHFYFSGVKRSQIEEIAFAFYLVALGLLKK